MWATLGLSIISNLLLTAVLVVVVVPWFRLMMKRRASRSHIPQPGECWVQSDGMLYVLTTGTNGVELISVDGASSPQRWTDTWDQWQQRLKINGVYFSGERRPLDVPS